MSEIFPLFAKCPCQISNLRFKSPEDVNTAFASSIVQQVIADSEQKIKSSGSIIVRKSGTEPMIKVRVEAEDNQLVEEISNAIVTEIEKYR